LKFKHCDEFGNEITIIYEYAVGNERFTHQCMNEDHHQAGGEEHDNYYIECEETNVHYHTWHWGDEDDLNPTETQWYKVQENLRKKQSSFLL
jgi:hypothetical protein